LDEKVIEAHLRGDIVAGIYPMCQDDTCHFLAIDFDDDGWQKDISTLREVCITFTRTRRLSSEIGTPSFSRIRALFKQSLKLS
jgi:hypothetical protein